MKCAHTHEDFTREHRHRPASNRQFGFLFGILFLAVSLSPLRFGAEPRSWAAGLSVLLFLVAIWRPAMLSFPNRLWMYLGLKIGGVSTLLATAFLFYFLISPISLVMRLTKRDALRLRHDPGASTYWTERHPPGPAPDTMARQF